MLVPVIVPDLGPGTETLRLSAWFFEPGDSVECGDSLYEVLISGVTCDVAAQRGGRLARIVRSLDAPVAPGDVIAWIESESAEGASERD
jgi:pyruvate/2-oxoglutarate dehydrogenase complex dihydrolipoamide acyltransferase (E2) component